MRYGECSLLCIGYSCFYYCHSGSNTLPYGPAIPYCEDSVETHVNVGMTQHDYGKCDGLKVTVFYACLVAACLII